VAELEGARRSLGPRLGHYLLQEAAPYPREFEIFYVRSAERPADFQVMSITETENLGKDPLPVNGIYNPQSRYRDRTPEFSPQDKLRLWGYLKKIGSFRLARASLRAKGIQEMLQGRFKIIEINLFLPMPLSLLDERLSTANRLRLIEQTMGAAARAVKGMGAEFPQKAVISRRLWQVLSPREQF